MPGAFERRATPQTGWIGGGKWKLFLRCPKATFAAAGWGVRMDVWQSVG